MFGFDIQFPVNEELTVHQLHISVIFVVLLHQGAEAAVILMFSLLTFFSFPAADPSELCLCPAHHGKNFKIWLKLNCNLS